jgi:hypothetical protein
MVRMYVRYKWPWTYYIDSILWSNGFVTNVQPFLVDGHYRTDIISGVGQPRSNSVVLLVLCMVACNGWGTDIILQVPQDNTNPAKKGENLE